MYCNDLREWFEIDPDYVINMDETPCNYDNQPKTKFDSKGNIFIKGLKSVNGAKTRAGDNRSTVCLSAFDQNVRSTNGIKVFSFGSFLKRIISNYINYMNIYH